MKIITFDTETTGTDTNNDRLLTCFMRAKDGERTVYEGSWVIDPGVEVPAEAAEVHGMDTDWVREHGRKDADESVKEIVYELELYAANGYVVTGYNSAFDLAMLNAECKRHCEGIGLELNRSRFLDPIIIDRAIDKYRKGSRKLVDVARYYGIKVEEDKAHAADYDVYLTEQLIPKVLNKAWTVLESKRRGLTPDEFVDKLQEWQREWKREWAEHLTEYFQSQGKTEEDGSKIIVEGRFPY